MVDVGDKESQERVAVASGIIWLQQATARMVRENNLKKGDVLTIAEVAGIQASKNTASLIPLCHPLQLTQVVVEANLTEREGRSGVEVTATVRSRGQTGVEMEALTGVSVALLTIYDMCKAVDKEMEIGRVRLIEKTKTTQ